MKYPRTFHLPFSPKRGNDDKVLKDVSTFLNRDMVLTTKLDGSNVVLESENCFARSHFKSPTHPSFDWLKAFHASIKHLIPAGTQIFCEFLMARHSVVYDNLPSYLMVIGVRAGNYWECWEECGLWAEELGIAQVPNLGFYNFRTAKELQEKVEELANQTDDYSESREGIVIRAHYSFRDDLFEKNVAKYVSNSFVCGNEHWSKQEFIKNQLRK